MTTDTQPIHAYGWKRDPLDARDIRLADRERIQPLTALPAAVDLRAGMPPIWDQSALGSCTAFSIGAGVQFLQRKQGIADFQPSQLFIYYQERVDDGNVPVDYGSSIRESAKAVANYGAAPSADWPYVISQFATKPPAKAYADALLSRITLYLAVGQTAQEMKSCLADGYPIHVGFSVYSSFETAAVASSGVAPLPNPALEKLLGGHAVVVVGYDDAAGTWLCRNSWGTGWGQSGYFTFPYAALLDPRLASDFWTLRKVTGDPPAPGPTPDPAPPAPGAMTLVVADDKANARATLTWAAWAGAVPPANYRLGFGATTPGTFSQTINAGMALGLTVTYPKDAITRYARVQAMDAAGAVLATSSVVTLGPSTPAPGPTPTPTPTPATITHRINVYSDGHITVDQAAEHRLETAHWTVGQGVDAATGDVGIRHGGDTDLAADSPLRQSQR